MFVCRAAWVSGMSHISVIEICVSGGQAETSRGGKGLNFEWTPAYHYGIGKNGGAIGWRWYLIRNGQQSGHCDSHKLVPKDLPHEVQTEGRLHYTPEDCTPWGTGRDNIREGDSVRDSWAGVGTTLGCPKPVEEGNRG